MNPTAGAIGPAPQAGFVACDRLEKKLTSGFSASPRKLEILHVDAQGQIPSPGSPAGIDKN
jgi:hypothetical protein